MFTFESITLNPKRRAYVCVKNRLIKRAQLDTLFRAQNM